MAKSLQQNTTIAHIELDGTEQRYRDEFDIPTGIEVEPWAKLMVRTQLGNRGAGRAPWTIPTNSNTRACLFTGLPSEAEPCW